jgi:hypothetical protein
MAMRKYLCIFCGLLFLSVGSAFAGTSTQCVGKYGVSVTGKKYRKNLRHLLLAGYLKGDKKKIFDQYGYTPHRLRFSGAGVKTERWRYLEKGLEFVFDSDSNLIEEREIPKEYRRAGISHY